MTDRQTTTTMLIAWPLLKYGRLKQYRTMNEILLPVQSVPHINLKYQSPWRSRLHSLDLCVSGGEISCSVF